jgi:pentatricopeptide repeat protein
MYTSAIYAFRYQRNPDAAEAVFNTLKARATRYPDLFPGKEPLTVSAASYNALLAVYAVSNELDDRGDKLLKEMEEKRLAWDSYTYTALMMGRGDRQEVSIWIHIYVSVNVNVYISINVNVYIFIYICIYIYVCIFIYFYMYIGHSPVGVHERSESAPHTGSSCGAVQGM